MIFIEMRATEKAGIPKNAVNRGEKGVQPACNAYDFNVFKLIYAKKQKRPQTLYLRAFWAF